MGVLFQLESTSVLQQINRFAYVDTQFKLGAVSISATLINTSSVRRIYMSMLSSLSRGLPRIGVLISIAAASLAAAHLVPEVLGSTGAPMAFGLGLAFNGLAFGDIALRIMQPSVDSQQVATEAVTNGNVGAGLVYLGRAILAAAVLMLIVTASRADTTLLPPNASKYLPTLRAEQIANWPGLGLKSTLGAQVEQETCVSLKSKGCWNPATQLKTSREQGIGLGQITRTFNADGSTRFDSLADIKRAYPSQLAGWSWDAPIDAKMQLRALVLKDKQGFSLIKNAATESDQLAMSFAAYNGGSGGLNSDRRACAGTKGCDTGKWFGNVALTSLKAKAAIPGYGQSFFAINRSYVENIMVVRRARYVTSLDVS